MSIRDEFEAAACKMILHNHPESGLTIGEIRESRRGEEYQTSTWSGMWWAWQASRAAIGVELPKKISSANTAANGYVRPEAEHYDEAIDACREALADVGLTVKP